MLSLGLIACLWVLLRVLFRGQFRTSPGGPIFLFRAFFPSWRFFDDVGQRPALQYRWRFQGQEWRDWDSERQPGRPHLLSFIYHPMGNWMLANQSLLLQFLGDLAALQDNVALSSAEALPWDKVHPLTSYGLVQARVEAQLVQRGVQGAVEYQFRILAQDNRQTGQDPSVAPWDEILVSPVHRVGTESVGGAHVN